MTKNLLSIALISIIGSANIYAQTEKFIDPEKLVVPTHRTCGTEVMDQNWENWFQQKISDYQNSAQAATRSTHVIPVVVHVIHNGTAIGSGYNISNAQIQSQIDVLNEDYNAANADFTTIPAAFQSVATNTGIAWCMATKDPLGNVLTEPGVDRISASSKGFTTTAYTKAYIDATIKPATIWDPKLYFNIWVLNIGSSLLGYATFPVGTGLTGLTTTGSATTDGVVILYNAFGRTGSVSSPYNKGRTATHEVGHWLGMRHIWGDGSCLTDYCADTPPQMGENYGCPTYPLITANSAAGFNGPRCNTTDPSSMFMNYMDYVDDNCMKMFTNTQRTRMLTAMTNGTYRKGLNASSANVCALNPEAEFIADNDTIFVNDTVSFTDLTPNNPTTWKWTAYPSTGVTFIPNTTTKNAKAKFTTVGTYSITLMAKNASGSNTLTKTKYIVVELNPTSFKLKTLSHKGITVSPNPNNGNFKINTSFSKNTDVDVMITDMVGRNIKQLKEKGVSAKAIEINIGDQPQGIYFITVRAVNDIFTERISVVK